MEWWFQQEDSPETTAQWKSFHDEYAKNVQDTSIKCVITGDGSIGKTCLVVTYTMGSFPGEYIPMILGTAESVIEADGKKVSLGLWDTSGRFGFLHHLVRRGHLGSL
eukprot:TRINITY_DN6204_c0_g1_i2.p1 TRINITY_DN6204_c0_g1~~TRINITY_DN6204_c0_g1_i2.p1  ORF type:complete len:107 (+),score=12.04 TRINITY_DN6204_c0_g1_i2:130-450(+)